MSLDNTKLAELKAVAPGARAFEEGGISYIALPDLKITVANEERVIDALLCPMQHGGYTTRLFFAEAFPQKGANWTSHNILSRAWHTWSWNQVPATLSPMQILAAHLKALR